MVWGLDIGGTKCALCVGDASAHVRARWQVNTRDYADWQALLKALLNAASDAPRPRAIGVSCGGPLDSARGLILSPPNLPGWDEGAGMRVAQRAHWRADVPAKRRQRMRAGGVALRRGTGLP